MKTLATINFEGATEEEIATFSIRDSARGVIYDAAGNIALMNVTKKSFYKLPGGGIEANEQPLQAFVRESLEEAGVHLSDCHELGLIVELKKSEKIVQRSYCYRAVVKGEKQTPQFTESEKENGFEVIWLPLEIARERIKADGYGNDRGKYIYERELTILEAAHAITDKK